MMNESDKTPAADGTQEFDFAAASAPPAAPPPAPAPEAAAAPQAQAPKPTTARRKYTVTEGNNLSFGRYLRELRIKNNLEFRDLEAETKIRADYLASIEQEDFKLLPPPVYVLAYVRKLCAFYCVSPERGEKMADEVRTHLELTLPGEFSKVVVDQEISDENDRLMKKFLLIAGVAVLLMMLLVGGVVSALRSPGVRSAAVPPRAATAETSSPGTGSAVQEKPFDSRKLQDLAEVQRIESGKLPVRDWQNR